VPDVSDKRRDDRLFGMWRDREDVADVATHIRRIRASRFNPDDSQNQPSGPDADRLGCAGMAHAGGIRGLRSV
jgi:hypothetical protein